MPAEIAVSKLSSTTTHYCHCISIVTVSAPLSMAASSSLRLCWSMIVSPSSFLFARLLHIYMLLYLVISCWRADTCPSKRAFPTSAALPLSADDLGIAASRLVGRFLLLPASSRREHVRVGVYQHCTRLLRGLHERGASLAAVEVF